MISSDETQQTAAPTKFLTNEVAVQTSKKTVVALDPKCLSCSGQASGLISTFKMACLAYAPSTVVHRSKNERSIPEKEGVSILESLQNNHL